jgi:hypothetical protein
MIFSRCVEEVLGAGLNGAGVLEDIAPGGQV